MSRIRTLFRDGLYGSRKDREVNRRAASGLCGGFVILALYAHPVPAADWVYLVSPGDTLWDLSERYLHHAGYWERLRALNGVENPRRLPPGTRLRVPLSWIRVVPTAVMIRGVGGSATVVRSGGQAGQPAEPGESLFMGDTLRTEEGGSVALEFADGSRITVYGNTQVRFDRVSAYKDTGMVDTRLRMPAGRVDANTPPAAGPGSRFEIHTPAAVSAVRGTAYRAAASDEALPTSRVEVLGGAVAVAGAGATRRVPSGFGTRVERGRPPPTPVRLLPPPDLAGVPAPVERRGWPIAWPPLEAARGYRVRIFAAADLEIPLWEDQVSSPRVPLPDLADGTYQLWVRAIDGQGLEGLDAVRELEIDARPEPPVPLLPAQGAVIRGDAVRLQWSGAEEAVSYRVQLVADGGSDGPIQDRAGVDATTLDLTGLPVPGGYRWRVASVASSGEQGPFSDPRDLETRPEPPRPEPAVAADGERLLASWPAGAPGQTYEAQLAEDPSFQVPLRDERLERPSLAIEQVTSGFRYLRVRVVEPDGYRGPWGATQRIEPRPDYGWLRWFVPAIAVLLFL